MTDAAAIIRPADAGDADALAVIGTATFLETYAGMIPGAAIVNQCRDGHAAAAYVRYMNEGARIWIGYEPRGAPVGYAMVTTPDIPGMRNGDAELRRIYVLASFHGTGLAQGLLNDAIAALPIAERLLVGFNQDNTKARAFYAKCGFEQIGTRRFAIGGHMFDDDVYALTLPDSRSGDPCFRDESDLPRRHSREGGNAASSAAPPNPGSPLSRG